jgi:hypothetical protein
MTDPTVHIQVDLANAPSTPPWFGEVAVVAHALQRYGILNCTGYLVHPFGKGARNLGSEGSDPSHFLLEIVIQKERTARSSILTMRNPTSCNSYEQVGSSREVPRCTMYFFHAKNFFPYFFYDDRRVIPR